MKRFSQLLDSFPSFVRPNYINVGLDLGSSQTRVRVKDRLRLQQPSCAIIHSQTQTLVALGSKAVQLHPRSEQNILFKAPIRKAVPTDVNITSSYIKAVLNQAIKQGEMSLLTQINGYCLIPSTATKVDRYLFEKLFEKVGLGRWQLISKAQVWSIILRQKKYKDCLGCIDLGGDTTEVILLDEQAVLAETIPFGGRKLVKRLLQLIRSEYGFQLSWESAEKLLSEIDLSNLDTKKSKVKITVRGKNITTGKPETITISDEALQSVVSGFYQELLGFIEIFLYKVPAATLTEVLDQGMLISGGLSQVAGSKSFFESSLNTAITLSDNPEEDLVRNLWQM